MNGDKINQNSTNIQSNCAKDTGNKTGAALEDIRNNKISIRAAAEKYGIPRSTLHDKLKGKTPEGPTTRGPDPVLTKDEELQIAEWCGKLSKCGFPLQVDDLLNTVEQILKHTGRANPFKNGRPGRTWLRGFFRRNPGLSLKEAENITKGRAVVTEEYIKKWFQDLSIFLESISQTTLLNDPRRIINGDETSFSLCPKTGKVIAPKSYKNVYQIQTGNEKETLTVLFVCTADGKVLPPMVIFPYIRPPKEVVDSVPQNWFLGRTESGWMRSETFFEYVANCVNVWIEKQNIPRPVLFFVDGHKSHLTMELSTFCDENGIILYALPANTTHIMQPLDVSVFKPLKTGWKETVRNWQSKNFGVALTKKTFCPLLEETINQNQNLSTSIINGFRKCGLSPFDPNSIDYSKCVKNNIERVLSESCETRTSNYPNVNEKDISLAEKVKYAMEVIKLSQKELEKHQINLNEILNVLENINTELPFTEEDNLPKINESEFVDTDTIVHAEDYVNVLDEQEILNTLLCSDAEKSAPSTPKQPSKQPISLSNQKRETTPKNTNFIPVATTSLITRRLSSSSSISNVTSVTSPTTPISRPSSSRSLQKHLFYPKLYSFYSKRKNKTEDRSPSAISSSAWREIYAKKEQEKIQKADAIKQRKLERLQKRELSVKKSELKRKYKKSNYKNVSLKKEKE
ncbi:uncharacterized protein LOC129606961 isoform X2 [Condylostylus longicornis]|uniref:uncharacterized protein LOC129606961 isoform X2 n=1 Tax=Condylostylus longicornis TaxID=2530218 RepID=UPI00244E27C4|nr:uncharacterized protein LOC129606961 isoform X2 [Condylostylus longicornis]